MTLTGEDSVSHLRLRSASFKLVVDVSDMPSWPDSLVYATLSAVQELVSVLRSWPEMEIEAVLSDDEGMDSDCVASGT